MANCARITACCRCCRHCVFCWRGCFYKDEFLLESFYEEISPQEWNLLENEARKIKDNSTEKIVLVKTNGLPPSKETAVSQIETSKPWRSLVDYSAKDFLDLETNQEKKSLNTKKFRSYSQPDFLAEMWSTSGGSTSRMKSLKKIFHRKKYARFRNEKDLTLDRLHQDGLECDTDSRDTELAGQRQRLKLQTKILTKRSQRSSHERERQDFPGCLGSSSTSNDYGQIEATISFAAHVRRQGPGFSASCTQTLRTCDLNTLGDLFESEVHSNVTFNPLFEDDDSDEDKRVPLRRHRLYTIDEESEVYDSGS
ncbi:uncharacterized protein [Porites lutea]|uniref:uncharacterized protein n=1 Tax=Porites lutea TaxID=51062 RepID=UPI003CC56338